METLGSYFKQARTKQRIYLREVAAITGVTIVYISDIEAGRKHPAKIDFIKKICDFLKIDFDIAIKLAIQDRKEVRIDIKDVDLESKMIWFRILEKWDTGEINIDKLQKIEQYLEGV